MAASSQQVHGLRPDDGVPLYVHVATSLRTRLAQQEWSVGERLPTLEQIGRSYGVALNTVRKAVELLSGEGLLESRSGIGTTVRPTSRPVISSAVRAEMHDPLGAPEDLRIDILRAERSTSPPPGLAQAYRLAPSYRRIVKIHAQREPYALLDVYVAADVFDRFPQGSENRSKLLALLRDFGRVTIAESRQELTVSHADKETASALDYPVAAPLVRVRRWKVDEDGILIFACSILYRSDLFVWDISERGSGSAPIIPDQQRPPE